MGNRPRRFILSLQQKFVLSIVLIIVPVMGVIFAWVGLRNERQARDQLINQARILSRQIVMTRQWISDCGGVMVAAGSKGAQGTRYFYDDRFDTRRGTFQRFTPSMVTKKLSTYSLRENLYHFKLAGLNPMNPENRPDEFDSRALYRFIHDDAQEYYALDSDGQKTTFRYSAPLHVDNACLQCHTGYTKGTIGGCLSIFFPAAGLKLASQTDRLRLGLAGVGLILVTILTLFFLLRRVVIRPLSELENMSSEISRGNLKARVDAAGGDELARLGKAFNTMAERLARSHHIMEDQVDRATRELSAANRGLQKIDQLKTDFIADMSHELRSPITAVQGGLDYLKRTITKADNRKYLTIMDNNLLRMTHLVSDLLDLTKIEAEKVEWNFEGNDLDGLIREVIEILSLKAQQKGVAIAYQAADPMEVEMDLERMEQVLVNLLENAIKFSGSAQTIAITVTATEDQVTVSVEDQGMGIAAENLQKIFKKFHTLPSRGGDGTAKGTGLGLTISRKIIQAHGGRIWAESTMGRGSRFTFEIPRRQNR